MPQMVLVMTLEAQLDAKAIHIYSDRSRNIEENER
jgi:hypothetical protein